MQGLPHDATAHLGACHVIAAIVLLNWTPDTVETDRQTERQTDRQTDIVEGGGSMGHCTSRTCTVARRPLPALWTGLGVEGNPVHILSFGNHRASQVHLTCVGGGGVREGAGLECSVANLCGSPRWWSASSSTGHRAAARGPAPPGTPWAGGKDPVLSCETTHTSRSTRSTSGH